MEVISYGNSFYSLIERMRSIKLKTHLPIFFEQTKVMSVHGYE